MKRFFLLQFMITLALSGFSQDGLLVDHNIISNRHSSVLNLAGAGERDLWFSISPDGRPQYGKHVSWNLHRGTNDEARFYHVRKGDWDRSAIQAYTENFHFDDPELYNPYATPNVHMGNNWIKLGKSWNFSPDNYAIAIISFTNRNLNEAIEGELRFTYPNDYHSAIGEIKIYNSWAHQLSVSPVGDDVVRTFKYEKLLPGEIRHIYVYVDFKIKTSRQIPPGSLSVEMVNYQTKTQAVGPGGSPHDPNEIILVNAYENTPTEECTIFANQPELVDLCQQGIPFWYNNGKRCNQLEEPTCTFDYSLEYPYCNLESEELEYRISCFNDGNGPAKDVDISCEIYNYSDYLFQDGLYNIRSSNDVQIFNELPDWSFYFENIMLPGINDERVVYTYDECSAFVYFKIKTKCDLKHKFAAAATIDFIDLNEESVGEVDAGEAWAVPEQGQYENIEPDCISCGSSRSRNGKGNVIESGVLVLQQTDGYIDISNLNLNSQNFMNDRTFIRIVDISGRILKQRSVATSQFITSNLQFDVTDLNSGIFILSIMNGKQQISRKFVHH